MDGGRERDLVSATDWVTGVEGLNLEITQDKTAYGVFHVLSRNLVNVRMIMTSGVDFESEACPSGV